MGRTAVCGSAGGAVVPVRRRERAGDGETMDDVPGQTLFWSGIGNDATEVTP